MNLVTPMTQSSASVVCFLTTAAIGDAPLFISGGYSDYSVDDGLYFGAGVTYAFDERLDGKFELVHDTALDWLLPFSEWRGVQVG